MSINFGRDMSETVSLLMSLLLQKVHVPTQFHERAKVVKEMTDSDSSGLVDSLVDFQISSACVDIKIDTESDKLNKILNEKWLANLNSEFRGKGIQRGIKGLQKEYFKERWKGASFPVLKITRWKEVDGLLLPVSMIFVNGGSIYAVDDNNDNSASLFGYRYFLGKAMKEEIEGEAYLMYKCFCRSFDKYPVPYLIRRGVYKNWKIIDTLKDKQIELVKQIIPYLFLIREGSEALQIQKDDTPGETELKEIRNKIQELLDRLNTANKEAPMRVTSWAEKIEHLIPDLQSMFRAELFASSEKQILAGMGFIDVAQPISSIPKDERVLIKNNGKIEQIKVEELKNKKGKIEVPTYRNGNCRWKQASLWSHPYKGKIYEIISETGTRVRITANHSIMVWDKELGLISKRADELTKRDLILELKNLNLNQKYQELIYYDYLGSNQTKKVKKPIKIKVDEDFGYFLGSYVAEGCGYGDYGLVITNTDEQFITRLLTIGNRIFNREGSIYAHKVSLYSNYKQVYELRFHSKGLKELFKEICGNLAHNKKIPSVIFNSPKSVQEAFLRGLLKGDGHFYKSKRTWDLTTSSEQLAYEVIILGRILGKYPHFRKKNKIRWGKLRTYYAIYFAQKEAFPKILLPKFTVSKRSYFFDFEEYRNKINKIPKDWSIKRIEKIKSYDYNDEVYDLEVKDNPTFVAGTNILVHNSRRDSFLNPRAFIKEVNEGIEDFKLILEDLISLIKEKNEDVEDVNHRKYNALKWIIASKPVTDFNTEEFFTLIRSLSDRGRISNETEHEIFGMNHELEIRRREREVENEEEVTLYPKVITNQEQNLPNLQEELRIPPERPKKKKQKTPEEETKDNLPEEKKEEPEKQDFVQAEKKIKKGVKDKQIVKAPYRRLSELPDYIKKLPKNQQEVWRTSFNYAWKRFKHLPIKKRESRAFRYANGVLKRLKRK